MAIFRRGSAATEGDSHLADYYRQGATWETDVARRNSGSRRIAWIVASVFGLLAAAQAAALVMLLPLKTYEPYIVEVDRSSGFVQEKRALVPGALSDNEAVTMSNVVRYIRARETYDPKALKENFDLAQVLSTGKASIDLTSLYTPGAPNNPIDILGRSANISVSIKAVSFPNKTTALVRFSSFVNKPTEVVTQNWQALVRFRYTSTPASNQYRFDNPLGFQVTEYRRDQETISAQPIAPDVAAQQTNNAIVHTQDAVPALPTQQLQVPESPQAPPPVVPAPVSPPSDTLIPNAPPPPLPQGGTQQ